ncbi:hypothetical protein COCNU_06G020950 [Cocos nucifera]|uniref:Germin-like protein n=1 Tax=Cocos nucifera TaxID=13894 RepID=A0A8K0IDK0_COCNU|nr:hypothetical protein COCNU_06G020950 [Cocos nucifera]
MEIPRLNTLSISMSHIDYSPGRLNPPHTHPCTIDMFFILDGILNIGFITTANKLITKTITKGNIFIFPYGLVYFPPTLGEGNQGAEVPEIFLEKERGVAVCHNGSGDQDKHVVAGRGAGAEDQEAQGGQLR